MTTDKLMTALQKIFGATKSEIIFAIVIIAGLMIGLVIKIMNQDGGNTVTHKQAERIHGSLDSLAEAGRTSYIGTGMDNESFEELSQGDTIIKEEKYEFKKTPSERIDLNSASRVQLMTLPGIGEKTADMIIEFRKSQPFGKPADIMKVKGIGEKKYEKLKEFIEVK